ncbi:ABC transporter permease [Sporichthya sp.]|uniref:branched-chain amino acid ABC transporter permease n=1 Tax=Sporichthya sp. TaxID=65475 RepID=UPI0017FEA395|nr:ABC transporter permease [Sporichthya sp.]MBA3745359.1 ABC transporter permease [Sporichthya sp.]
MNQFLNYMVPGVADGSVYALAAIGLVLTYKTSGVFNFAHGALAATGAYVFYEGYVEQGWKWPFAFLVSLLVVGVLGGLILERLATLLASAPTVTTVVATVGLLVLLQSLMTAIYGASDKKSGDFLPTNGPRVGDVTISYGEMMITGFCLGAALALFAFFGRTRMGRAMTAVVDDPNLLALQKSNPAVVRRLSWVLGSCFATISGMLLAPKLGVSVGVLVLIVIAAYGAAAVGLFENLPLTVAGAFFIGILVNYLPSQTQKTQSLFLQSMPRNVPFIVLLLVFLFVPARMLTERGVRNARRFKPPKAFSLPVTAAGLAALLGLMIAVPHVVAETDVTVYSAFVAYAIIFMSLGMLVWMSGQISLCHLGFAAIGATVSGKLMTLGFFGWLPLVGDKTVSWPVAVIIGGLVAIPFGAIVAIPAIRLAGIYVAIATFGFGILLQQAFYLAPVMFDGASLVQHPRPGEEFSVGATSKRFEPVEGTSAGLFGIDFSNEKNYYYLALSVLVVMAAIVLLVQRSRLGALLRAMADSGVALEAHGANTNVMRIIVFCLSAFMAGVGGGVLAGVTQSASGNPGGTFDYTVSLIFVAVLGFCGRRPILSPILAAFAFQVIKIYPPFDDPTMIKYRGVMFGALAIFVAVAPALNLNTLLGTRGKERALDAEGGGGGSSVRDRLDVTPVRPVTIRTVEEPVLLGSKGSGA